MNKNLLLIQCGDMGVQWIPFYLKYFNLNWNCDDFIDTIFLFETIEPTISTIKRNVFTTKMGEVKWGTGMINFLKNCEYDKIILVHEDYFIVNKPDIEKVKRLLEIMEENKMPLLKICGDWAGNTETEKIHMGKLSDDENIYIYSLNGLYITSHQPSIWTRDYLLKTIEEHYNPWIHEMEGHKKAKELGIEVYAYLGEEPIPIVEAVTAGKPRPGEEKYFVL